jgi:hypothetical protein
VLVLRLQPSFSFQEKGMRIALQLCLVGLITALAGCSGATLGKVNGKVVANGQPVTGGTLTFAPLDASSDNPASPASGQVQADGTFVLTTLKDGDGAAVGKHKVSYIWPARKGRENWDETAPNPGPPPPETISPFEGLKVKEPAEVEIKAGSNDITVELEAGPPVVKPPQ